jgi:hypothetical protein
MSTAMIETDLSAFVPAPGLMQGLDPLSQALHEQGYRSISVGLRTVQLDGALYDLCPEGRAALASWLDGKRWPPSGTVRLVRHTIKSQSA